MLKFSRCVSLLREFATPNWFGTPSDSSSGRHYPRFQCRLLLQQKADDSWSLPAGAIEPGESPENAVKREVLEETGYDVSAQMLAGVCGGSEFRYTYANGLQVEYTVVLYYCTAQKIDSPLDPETRSIAYFSEGEMPHLAMPYPKELLFPSRMKP